MTPAQENELLRTVRVMKRELSELMDLVTPIAPEKNKVLDAKGACEVLRCSRWTLYRLIRSASIPFTKKGNKLLFLEGELLRYIKGT